MVQNARIAVLNCSVLQNQMQEHERDADVDIDIIEIRTEPMGDQNEE